MLHSCLGESTANPPHSRMREREGCHGRGQRQQEGGKCIKKKARWKKEVKVEYIKWKRKKEKKKKRIANHYLESIRRGPALTEWDREEEEEVGQVTRRHAGIVLLTHGKYATTFLAKDLLVVDWWGNESWHELVMQTDDVYMHAEELPHGTA